MSELTDPPFDTRERHEPERPTTDTDTEALAQLQETTGPLSMRARRLTAARLRELEAENDRLRAALERIKAWQHGDDPAAMADKALRGEET